MALPAGFIARALARAFLSAVVPEPRQVIKGIVFLLLVPLMFLLFLFTAPLTIFERIPIVSMDQARLYHDAAEAVSQSTDSPCDPGVTIPWQQVLAVDAVRLEQDFRHTSYSRAKKLAREFIEEDGKCTHCTGSGEDRQCTSYTTYRLLSLEEVTEKLGLDLQEVEKYLQFDLAFLLGEGGYLPPDWKLVEGALRWPVPGHYMVTSPFGMRDHPVNGGIKPHEGIDVAAPINTPVVAVADGVVTATGWMGGYGISVIIQHSGAMKTRYSHLNEVALQAGSRVKAGDVIGYVGSTGVSTGSHLHFEVLIAGRPVNPLNYYGGA